MPHEYELADPTNAPENHNESTQASRHTLYVCGEEIGKKKDYKMDMPEPEYTSVSTKRPADENLGDDEQPAQT